MSRMRDAVRRHKHPYGMSILRSLVLHGSWMHRRAQAIRPCDARLLRHHVDGLRMRNPLLQCGMRRIAWAMRGLRSNLLRERRLCGAARCNH